MTKVKVINKDAQLSITIGTSFISDLQGMLLAFLSERSEEDIVSFKEAMSAYRENGTDFPEDWMKHLHVITSLLGEIEQAAEKSNQIVEKDVDELLSESGS